MDDTAATKQYTFILYFNYNFKGKDGLNREREWAEGKRGNSLIYLKKLFENKAKFACVARDENESCLLLRGYMNLNSPCTQAYAKKLLGRYSACRPSYFGDMVSLCLLIHIDKDLTVTGRLPIIGNGKVFAGSPGLVVKVLRESIEKKDFEQRKDLI